MPIMPVASAYNQRDKLAQLLALEQQGRGTTPMPRSGDSGGGLPGLAPRPRPMVMAPPPSAAGQFADLLGQQLGGRPADPGTRNIGDGPGLPPVSYAPNAGRTDGPDLARGDGPALGVAAGGPRGDGGPAPIGSGGGYGDSSGGGATAPVSYAPNTSGGGGLAALGRMSGTPIGQRNRAARGSSFARNARLQALMPQGASPAFSGGSDGDVGLSTMRVGGSAGGATPSGPPLPNIDLPTKGGSSGSVLPNIDLPGGPKLPGDADGTPNIDLPYGGDVLLPKLPGGLPGGLDAGMKPDIGAPNSPILTPGEGLPNRGGPTSDLRIYNEDGTLPGGRPPAGLAGLGPRSLPSRRAVAEYGTQ